MAGFGLLETLAGLVVFVILVLVSTKAYRNAVSNHKDASEVKAVTDAVSVLAEKLSGLTLPVLAGPGSPHLAWSEPRPAGAGKYHYRYRIVPAPKVRGVRDASVAGLEVEAGILSGSRFSPDRTFATLIAPGLASRSDLGARASTQAERDAEAAFHAGLVREIADLTGRVVPENQRRLNSFSCYDRGQCCKYMEKYMANPRLYPRDGLEQKCQYRCALGGDIPLSAWRRDCGLDFCALSPWKSAQDCCRAIASGECKSGSACARVCIECHGTDGSKCGPPPCGSVFWGDLFDCAEGTTCDGAPLPDGAVAGWGDVKAACRSPACAALPNTCHEKVVSCCHNYWSRIRDGLNINPIFEICASISTPQECCDKDPKFGFWTFNCGVDGRLISARFDPTGEWYCGFPTEDWHSMCAMMTGCTSIRQPAGAPGGGCQAWTGPVYTNPWIHPVTGQNLQTPPVLVGGGTGGTTITTGDGDGRQGTLRDGDSGEPPGGRE